MADQSRTPTKRAKMGNEAAHHHRVADRDDELLELLEAQQIMQRLERGVGGPGVENQLVGKAQDQPLYFVQRLGIGAPPDFHDQVLGDAQLRGGALTLQLAGFA
jgi:hypothetical protein